MSADSYFGSTGNPQSLNLYAYALNNPLRWIDPTGHSPDDPIMWDGLAFPSEEAWLNYLMDPTMSFADLGLAPLINETINVVGEFEEIVAEHTALEPFGGFFFTTESNIKAAIEADHSPKGPAAVIWDAMKVYLALGAVLSGTAAESFIELVAEQLVQEAVGKVADEVIELATTLTIDQQIPGDDLQPHPSVTESYRRPPEAGPTAAQRAAVQGRPCANCGIVTPNQIADHIEPLVVEYYRTGTIDIAKQTSVGAVQPHCPTCSSTQGGRLSGFARRMLRLIRSR